MLAGGDCPLVEEVSRCDLYMDGIGRVLLWKASLMEGFDTNDGSSRSTAEERDCTQATLWLAAI